MEYKELLNRIDESSKILVGLGETINSIEQYNILSGLLEGKDYYVVSLDCKDTILRSELDEKRIAIPMFDLEDDSRWNDYLKWIQNTINKSILILEVGVGFMNPEIIRFPFEKIAMYNNKAFFVRVNSNFYQLAEEIAMKGESVKCNGNEFLNNLWNAR